MGTTAVALGLAVVVVVPHLVSRSFTSSCPKVLFDLEALRSAIEAHAAANDGRFPESLDELLATEGGGPWIRRDVLPRDSWGNGYVYEPPRASRPYRLFCLGADGAPGGDGEDRDFEDVGTFYGE